MLDLTKLKSAEKLDAKAAYGRLKERSASGYFQDPLGDNETYEVLKEVPGLIPSVAAQPEVTPEQLRTLCEQRGVAWDDRYVKRTVRYWASDQRVDDDGDIVVQSWDFKRFEKNSPMPWAHAWRDLPLGRYLTWKVGDRAEGDYAGPALKMLGVFALPEVNPLADDVCKMVQAGLLPGCSVGFQPIDVLEVKDPEERKSVGLGPRGLVFAHQGLLENSPCTIPANPGAVTFSLYKDAAAQGLLTRSGFQVFREIRRQEALRTRHAERSLADSEHSLIRIASMIWPDVIWTPHRKVDEQVELYEKSTISGDITTAGDVTRDTAPMPAMPGYVGTIHTKLDALLAASTSHASKLDQLCTAMEASKKAHDQLGGLVQEAVDLIEARTATKTITPPTATTTKPATGVLDTRLAKAIANAEAFGSSSRNGEKER